MPPLLLLLALAAVLPAAQATVPIAALPENARLALCGDSITEQMLYTRYVAAYLLACAGRPDVSVFQFGWGGENADQFAHRIRRGDLDAFMPTAVTVLYGANDAAGVVWSANPGMYERMWRGRVGGILDELERRYPATTAHTVLCGPTWFGPPAVGNETLARFRALNQAIAGERRCGFADVHQRLADTAAALGADRRLCGSDGVHPGPNGHLVIAYAVLRALGCTGAVATITVDMAGGATASTGHTVQGAQGGRIELTSTRYPFCCADDGSQAADGLATVLPVLPFQQDLNRFVLVVRNLATAGAEVGWGGETRRFTRAQLAAGVNLAEAFPRTPFDGAFAELMRRLAAQQEQERRMIKSARDATAPQKGWTAADVAARDALAAATRAGVVPVQHVITIVPGG